MKTQYNENNLVDLFSHFFQKYLKVRIIEALLKHWYQRGRKLWQTQRWIIQYQKVEIIIYSLFQLNQCLM